MTTRSAENTRRKSVVKLRLGWFAGLVIGSFASVSAQGQDRLTLRIHEPFASPIVQLDVDADNSSLAAATTSNAVVLWNAHEPNVYVTHHLPVRREQSKRAHSVAISPSGDMIAYSSPPLIDPSGGVIIGTSRIYLLRHSDGSILRIIDVATRPQSLRFSPNGDYLAATLSDGYGLRVWSTHDWALAYDDDDGYAGDTPGLLLTLRDGRDGTDLRILTSGDSGVRAYRVFVDGVQRIARSASDAIGLERPDGLASSPSGDLVAVGDRRFRGRSSPVRLRVALINSDTLLPARAPLEIQGETLLHERLLDLRYNADADQF